ncbi:type II secretion system F family protein [Lacisediminimonas sp.]|uniref:type II secretion system F family protein n=1 Tax=Lacisediminimonas sp. TaxID=3060582 RepID=UPI002720976E|nr:type II secretion system F family protein [Lacisediminimonas sp.]MDO8301246.1 type II secretion system F family protein [Lacisediminimonas sp.]
MNALYFFYLTAVFLIVFGISVAVFRWTSPDPLKQRMQEMAVDGAALSNPYAPGSDWMASIARLSGPFAKLSVPEIGWENSPMRARFMNAGLRGSNAAAIYFAAKTILAVLLPLLAWLTILLASVSFESTTTLMLILLLAATTGFYAPNLLLSAMIRRRQLEIVDHFPDSLDLMTVCVEAGLAVDAAIARIAAEMVTAAPALAEEMHLVTLDLRAGSSKERALRNLAIRTGVEDIDSLVAMLIQAERFGTSIGDSLRVHSDSLRTRRRQKAEEAAAKVALKLLFPLIFCIFPAIMLVLLGPAMMQLFKVLSAPGQGIM